VCVPGYWTLAVFNTCTVLLPLSGSKGDFQLQSPHALECSPLRLGEILRNFWGNRNIVKFCLSSRLISQHSL
jgi:hypothetical protein